MDSNVTGTAGQPGKGRRAAADRASSNPGGRTSLVEPSALCALAVRPLHGYNLKRAVEEMTEGLVSLDLPAYYRMLRRFEAEGLVESSWAPGDFGPQRREYTLTPAGRALLADWRRFLARQRHACQLTTDAIDAALGVADQTEEHADSRFVGPADRGGWCLRDCRHAPLSARAAPRARNAPIEVSCTSGNAKENKSMSKEMMSRRNFLGGVGVALGLAVVPALALAPDAASAAPVSAAPWTYTPQDAEAVARRAFDTYYTSGCAEATWGV
jgi:DNA-binding PadR family transcriptional regulator